MTKILVNCFSSLGGSGVIAARLAKYLAKKNYQIHFLNSPYTLPPHNIIKNLFHHELPCLDYPLFRNVDNFLPLIGKALDIIKHFDINVIHAHYLIPHGLITVLLSEVAGNVCNIKTKTVLTAHGTDILLFGKDKLLHPLIEYSLQKGTHITCVSSFLQSKMKEMFGSSFNSVVIPNFVDYVWNKKTKEEKNKKFREQLGIPLNKKIILHVSNMRPVKRIVDTMKIIKEISKIKDILGIIVGDGPDMIKVEEFIEKHNLKDKVLCVGTVDDVSMYYAVADLLLVTSSLESFSLATLEAMSHAVPVVSSTNGGVEEYLINRFNGFLCKTGDIPSFIEVILELFENNALREEIIENGIATAKKYLTADIAPLYEKIYLS